MHRALLILALSLALFKGALAPGLMLAPSPEGLVVTICSAHQQQGGTLFLTPEGGLVDPATAPDAEHKSDPCPFATAAAPALFETPAPVLAPVVYVVARRAARLVIVSIGRGLAAPPPPAQGPPLAR